MPTPPAAGWPMVPVRATIKHVDGDGQLGKVVFTPAARRLRDQATLTQVVGSPISADLNDDGTLTTTLPATDWTGATPTLWTWQVQELFDGGQTYSISVPQALIGTGIDLGSVAPVSSSAGVVIPVGGGGGGSAFDPTPLYNELALRYTKTESDARYATTAQGGLAATAVQPAALAAEVTRATNAEAAEVTARQAGDALAVKKAGDTMTGPLTLSGDPTNVNHAANRAWVLAQIAALTNGAPAELDTFLEAFNRFQANESTMGTIQGQLAGKQPYDDDLNAIAGLATTVYGRDVLTRTNATALRLYLGLDTAAVQPATAFATAAQGAQADANALALTKRQMLDLVVSAPGVLTLDRTNVVTAAGTYTAPALAASVGTPPQRFAIRNRSGATITLQYPDEDGNALNLTVLPGMARVYRQGTASGYGLEDGIPLSQLDSRYAGGASKLLFRAMPPLSSTVVIDQTERTLFSGTIAAADVAALDLLDGNINFDLLNNSGASITATVKWYLGGTLAASWPITCNSSANRMKVVCDVDVGLASLAEQRWGVNLLATGATAAALDTPNNARSAIGAFATTAVSLATDQVFLVTIVGSNAVALNTDARLHLGSMRRTR